MHANLRAFADELDQKENRRKLELALPKHVDVAGFARIVIRAVEAEPLLYDADRGSLMRACLDAAQDGLLPDGREAAIVPYRHRNSNRFVAQWQPMVWGLVKLVRQSEQLVDIASYIVREADAFDHWVDEKGEHFTHRPDYAQMDASPVLAYAFARLVNGGFYFEPMSWTEMERFRELSKAKADDTPWSKWPDEMAKVRPLKRLCKRLPMTTAARAALARDDAREALLFDAAPDDPIQAINRAIHEGKATPAVLNPAALTNDPSPTPEVKIASHTIERVIRKSSANNTEGKPRRVKKDTSTVEREPTLEEVLERIDTASNSDELADAGALASQMRSEGAKKIARDAYGQKMTALRTTASTTPDGHGEPASTNLSYAEVREQLERAASLEALDEAAANIGAVSQTEHRGELLGIAQALREGFTQ
ncbi:recombinase RecT [Caballeronia sp. ATUFL_M1_KS5A]|uniref:recombinase RecT n=1 Tax=Caballeronia sp. ATUFL_M1_KS5A TaxID=2921778 RepID=UPI002027D247|nr:recombinase RecT [Caballeronia sp. ATUFL_M1_KS5A]